MHGTTKCLQGEKGKGGNNAKGNYIGAAVRDVPILNRYPDRAALSLEKVFGEGFRIPFVPVDALVSFRNLKSWWDFPGGYWRN